ncbi:MAG: phosphate transport system regulatory protein PhoU [Deltaproteobacteria bacterium CG11_big_fil_rev_8_21_14_0_20_49_13]|nr:MAG: phosphate transport system regulatory protein PhoU [Deltaproteobacteria bacterium CG11_big_fil_rev_8_21_14_0_20_49_13]
MNQHIDHHFDEALSSLKQQILLMGSKVEAMLSDCVRALKTKDTKLAARVVESDHAVNALEVAIDEQCIQLLARYQPAASDLRFITRGLKIVTDLERVGDLAVNASQRVTDILKNGEAPIDLTKMTLLVQNMLKESLDAFVEKDVIKAEEVLKSDDEVDDLTERYITELLNRSETEPKSIRILFPATSIVRYFERIADHSTNIAELAIFMVKGRDVRHGKPT